MATYAIGDVQGCFEPLQRLLQKIQFNPLQDTLWFTGDLVNRGPQSLEVLRFVAGLGENHQTVLGNHDLHLLAVAAGVRRENPSDTLHEILTAPDKDALLQWLRMRPLLVRHEKLNYAMTHAGLAPAWTLAQAAALAQEVEKVLRGDHAHQFFENMYGDVPDRWEDTLTGVERWRCIINYFTRMRFCHHDGRLDLTYKGTIENKDPDLIPWFDVKPRANADINIIFGHWAALNGEVNVPHVFALDTGCVWGNKLTAFRLEDGMRFAVTHAPSQ